MTKPVYIINGFLESGKTEFITFTLGQPYFQIKGKTLLILCEEGENEYDPALLKKSRTDVVLIEEEEEFTPNHLIELEKQYKPARIIIEYNGMWQVSEFEKMKLPAGWAIEQKITTVDASTFQMYLTNLKPLFVEMVKGAELVLFNRCEDRGPLAGYRRSVKVVNGRTQVYFESSDGSSNEVEEILPFDLSKDVVEVADEDFGIWYVDAMDNPDKYKGKTMKMKAVVYRPKSLFKDNFVPGRFAMTCCADDIRFIGYKCKCDKVTAEQLKAFKDRDFIMLTAKVNVEYQMEYKGKGVVLYATDIQPAEKPEDDIVYFN